MHNVNCCGMPMFVSLPVCSCFPCRISYSFMQQYWSAPSSWLTITRLRQTLFVLNEVPPLAIMHHWINQEAEIGHWEALVRLMNKYDTSPLLIHLLDATLQHLYMHFVGADV